MLLYPALLLGFLGSWHCVGMCGPIALALPVPREHRLLGFFTYHIGRIGIYTLFGVLLGLVGYSTIAFDVQRHFTVIAGVILLLIAFMPMLSGWVKRAYFQSRFMLSVKKQTVARFKSRTFSSAFVAGMLNGFLPCGLIYLAAATAMMSNTLTMGALVMVAFGLGTLPGLLAVWLIPTLRMPTLSALIPRLSPVFSLLMGLLLIYRGISIQMPVLDSYLGAIGLGKITICN